MRVAGKRVGVDVRDAAEFYAALRKTKPGDEIILTITRAGAPTKLIVALRKPPLQIVRPEIENSILRRDKSLVGIDDQYGRGQCVK